MTMLSEWVCEDLEETAQLEEKAKKKNRENERKERKGKERPLRRPGQSERNWKERNEMPVGRVTNM